MTVDWVPMRYVLRPSRPSSSPPIAICALKARAVVGTRYLLQPQNTDILLCSTVMLLWCLLETDTRLAAQGTTIKNVRCELSLKREPEKKSVEGLGFDRFSFKNEGAFTSKSH
jgi:hypothetical protein